MKSLTHSRENVSEMPHLKDFRSAEKRKHIRRYSSISITCRAEKTDAQPSPCLLVNISKGGAAIECKNSFSAGTKVTVSFTAPDNREISVLMEVLRISHRASGTLYGARYSEDTFEKSPEFGKYLLKYFNLY